MKKPTKPKGEKKPKKPTAQPLGGPTPTPPPPNPPDPDEGG